MDVNPKSASETVLEYEQPPTGEPPKPYTGPIESPYNYNGHPFVGATIPNLKNDDPAHKQPKANLRSFTKQFSTKNPAEMEEYSLIVKLSLENKVAINYDKQEYNQQQGTWHILINWVDTFYT